MMRYYAFIGTPLRLVTCLVYEAASELLSEWQSRVLGRNELVEAKDHRCSFGKSHRMTT